MNFKSFLIEDEQISVIKYIINNAKPRINFAIGSKEANGESFENKIEHKSEVYFSIFRDKLVSLVKHYSQLAFPHGIAWEEEGRYTKNNTSVAGACKVMWTKDFPEDILMEFAKKYVSLVNNFLPVMVFVAPHATGNKTWCYTHVHPQWGASLDSVVILFYENKQDIH